MMQNLRTAPNVPAHWASAGIVDAQAFTIGNATRIHRLTHAQPNAVRAACGAFARCTEWTGPLATWAANEWDCPTCQARPGHDLHL